MRKRREVVHFQHPCRLLLYPHLITPRLPLFSPHGAGDDADDAGCDGDSAEDSADVIARLAARLVCQLEKSTKRFDLKW